MVNLPATQAITFSHPNASLSFGAGSPDDWSKAFVSLRLDAGMAPSVNSLEVTLSANYAPTATIGDTGSLSLGFANGDDTLVFTGQVQGVRYGLDGKMIVTATDGSGLLAQLRINQSYEKQKAGDIVRDLAGRAGVSTGNLQDGTDFPFYVLDDRSNAYQHIATLARKCGFLAYITPQGELEFAPVSTGQPVQNFTYAKDILALRTWEVSATVGSVMVIGEGAASSQGQDAWNWLLKDPSAAQAKSGSGTPERLVVDGSLRSAGAAQSAAEGLVQSASRCSTAGRLLVPGTPNVTIGSTIQVSDAPQDKLNNTFLVRGLRHTYSKQSGFTTLVEITLAGSDGMGGL